jgi:2-polyprenyl-3-methyl-5-hydroxy-6-metoxy-1,4-benzoquinol methylase
LRASLSQWEPRDNPRDAFGAVMLRGAMKANAEHADVPAPPAWRGVAERFAHLRAPGGEALHEALARHFAHLADHPVLPLHFEYAATANDRGRQAAARLAGLVPVGRQGFFGRRTRVLDVGCAYGGFLVAFAERGARVTGIDVDARYVRLAALNLRERGLDAQLVHGDAGAEHRAFRGRFDLVIANDVLEHVREPAAFLRNLRAWLAPDGVAYLEIPNGAWPPYVGKDGHHQLFGVTLLDFAEASEYMRLLSPGGRYDTYNYLDAGAYERLFGLCGLSFELLPAETGAHTVEGVLAQCAALEREVDAGLATVPEPMRGLVGERVAAYLARVAAAPRTRPDEVRRFLLDYGPAFWTVLGRRA